MIILKRIQCIALLLVLCIGFMSVSASSPQFKDVHTTKFASSSASQSTGPSLLNTQSVLNFEVRFNMNGNTIAEQTNRNILSTWSPLESLSLNDFELTSTAAPTVDTLDLFYPFGKQMFFSFDVPQGLINPNQQTLAGEADVTDGNIAEHFEFHLEVDESVMSTNFLEYPTFSKLNDDESTIRYPKHTNFKGTRMNSRGQVDTLLVAVMTNTDGAIQNDKKKLEAQSMNNNNNRDVEQKHKTLANTDYVVEAILMAADGKLYQISTYNTLLFQMQQQIDEYESVNKQHVMAIQEHIDVLSHTLSVLQTQAALSSTGLSISELNIDNAFHGAKCGVGDDHYKDILSHHQHKHTPTKEQSEDIPSSTSSSSESSLSIQPLWSLSPWTKCHSRSDKITSILFNLYHGITYRKFMSETNDATKINDAKVAARSKLLISMMNVITIAQFNVFLSVKSIVEGDGTAMWDPADLAGCGTTLDDDGNVTEYNTNIYWALFFLREGRMNETSQNKAAFAKAFVKCYTKDTVGLAFFDTICKPSDGGGNAVSSITGLQSAFIALHEVFHIFGTNHVFPEPPKSTEYLPGTVGSIMDYDWTRLGEDEPIESDRRQLGFSRQHSWNDICSGLNKTWELYSGEDGTCWSDVLNIPNINDNDENNDNPSSVKTYEQQICNRNGIVDPWEECDVGEHDTKCCKNCKLAEWATCDDDGDGIANDSQCCENCIASKTDKRCTLATDSGDLRSGICYRGKCIEDGWGCARFASSGLILTCPDSDYQKHRERVGTCHPSCPIENCGDENGDGRFFVHAVLHHPSGSFCSTDNGQWGVCLGATVFNQTVNDTRTMRCQPFGAGEFSWRYTVLQDCQCGNETNNKIDLIDTYVCLDPSGNPVSSTYCEHNLNVVPKPPRKVCTPCENDTTPMLLEPFPIVDASGQVIIPQNKPSPAGSFDDGKGTGFSEYTDNSAVMLSSLLSSKTIMLIFAIVAFVIL